MDGRIGLLPVELRILTSLGNVGTLAELAPLADWELTLGLARYHRISGPLGRAIDSSTVRPHVPAPMWSSLRDELDWRGAWYRQQVVPQLTELVDAFEDRAIRPTILKGAALVTRGWVDAAARPMADLDLLVRRSEVQAASELLHDLGYRNHVDRETATWARANHYQDPAVHHDDHPLPVELHGDIQHPRHRRRFPVTSLQVCDADLRGRTVTLLSAADQLAHLCLHFWNDRARGQVGALGQLYDLAGAANRWTDDGWEQLASDAAQRGNSDTIAAAMATARLLLDVAITCSLPRVHRFVEDARLCTFIIRRVLAPRPDPVQLLVVAPDVEHNARSVAARIESLLRRRGSASPSGGDLVRAGAWLVRHPADARSELRIERWSHSLA